MRLKILMFIPLLLALGLAGPVRAQAAMGTSDVRVSYTFGEQISFSTRIQDPATIQQAYIFILPQGDQQARSFPLMLAADGSTQYVYSIQKGVLRPFASINFWFEALLTSGDTSSSPQYFFTYSDNRYAWRTLEAEHLRLHWYDGDATFGQAALDAAQTGLLAIQSQIPVAPAQPIEIYIYSSAAEVQNVFDLGGLSWVAGQAFPDLGVALVSIPPDENQAAEMGRQIPHELAHVLLYRMTGPAYDNLPTWLREGLARLVEQNPNAQDAQVLSDAGGNKSLLPLADLCGLFPQDASGASLAYIESASFVRYLHDSYGPGRLQKVIQAYVSGVSCDGGVKQVYRLSLAQLDQRWQQAVLGNNAGGIGFVNLLPYLAVLLVILGVPASIIWLVSRKKNAHGTDKPE